MTTTTIVIATTEGPSHLLRLAHEGEGLQSVVCLNRTTQQAPISSAYESFVSRPTGLIESRFGPGGIVLISPITLPLAIAGSLVSTWRIYSLNRGVWTRVPRIKERCCG